jgi:hypothetical protein
MASNETVYGHDGVRAWIRGIIIGVIATMRSATIIFGTLSVLIIDLAIGATALGLLFTHSADISVLVANVSVPALVIATAFSVGTSALQLSMWDSVLRGKKQTYMQWSALALITLLDTMLDIAAVGYLMYGKLSLNVIADGQQPRVYWIVIGIVGLVSAFDSYYINMMLQHLKDDDEQSLGSLVHGEKRLRPLQRLAAAWNGRTTSASGPGSVS